jgi:hypothetical protein
VIKLADTKSGDPQLVTMNPPARRVLKGLETERARIGMGSCRRVSNPKQPISKAGIEAAWRKLAKAAQIEDVRMDDLRHTGRYLCRTNWRERFPRARPAAA